MSSKEDSKAYRDRLRTGKTVPVCSVGCGKQLRGKQSKLRGICSVCWKRTDEYKAATAERVKQLRESRKQEQE